MQTFLHYRWRVPSTLHRLHLRRIIPLLLLAQCVTGAKAADVPSTWKPVTFNEDIRYSQWVINSRISDFYAKDTKRGFNTYDKDGKWISNSKGDQAFDYVPGLVAKAVLEAYANYKDFDWSKPWFYSVMHYAKDNTYTLVATSEATNFSGITLDDMNACKMYFPLMETGALSTDAKSKGETAITNVLKDMKKYNELYVIGGSASGVKSSDNTTVQSMFGGWFHKPSYKDQMWCDGLYMGAALLAQIVNYTKSTTNVDGTSDWNLITKQFTISWNQLYNSEKGLLYHAFTANPKDAASSKWAGISNTEGAEVYHSAAFWGRAMGWYFLALVDVLEQMPSNNSNRATLIDYLQKLAAGLAKYQDGTGCWYQVVDQKDKTLTGNYLESSCTSLFAAAYLKAVRLKLLSTNGTYNYETIGKKAFEGAVAQFMKYDTFDPTGTTVQLVHNCASAGLGGSSNRSGSREYYINGSDVGQTNEWTEGKVMGAFIMAATEYEIANKKDIRFSYDLAPSYTLAQGGSIKAEALGSGTITYQWYKTDGTTSTAVTDATTSATFSPAESGTYYCKATSGSTTIYTSKTVVTVSGTSNENGGSENGSGSTKVTINNANRTSEDITYTISSGTSWNASGYYTVEANATITVKAKEGATISQIKLTYSETGDNRVGGSVTVNTGTYTLSDKVGTWTGSANQVVFTTTNTASISSIEVTYTTGTTVLNESDLKCTQSYTNNHAWTPAANGTIDVSKLVSSSSKGAYSITLGTDVATISGTTITALKAGAFTLSQAADDKYNAGSINITVRIGEDVTSDGSNAYSFTAQTTDVSDGMTITRKDITMTFGNDGFWSQPSANSYTNGQRNPKDSDGKDPSAGKIPSIGTFYKFTPTKPGSLAVKIKLGTTESEGSYYLRPLYVSENGTFISAKLTGDIQVGTGQAPSYSKNSYEGNVTFDVKKGKDYFVYVTGSKLGFYGFEFTPATTYTITYNMNGHGTQIEEVTDVNTLPETLPTPTADGYTFVGWYTNAELTQEATAGATLTSDVTLYAKWTPITDLFTLTGVTSTTVSVNSQTTVAVTGNYATITGGSAELYNGHSLSKDMILNSQINLNGSSSSYLKITLNNSLKIGDEIIINPAASSFILSADESNKKDTTTVTGSYVIQQDDAVVGKNVIFLYRGKNSNSLIEYINISRHDPATDSRATFKYNGAEIAFSEKTPGDKSAYTTTLEIGASKKGQTITITPKTKVAGATITQDKTTVSEDITITVPSTIGQTTTSTYTVTSKDGTSTTTYEINVKLVKENVVLEYAQREVTSSGEIINIIKEWTWDRTANSTKPTFTNPTLKVYLANADGTKSDKEVTNVTGIKYKSDVTDVATVNETTGAITIQENANGGAKIYAILEGHPDYNDANTFFNIVVKQGYSYSVADDATIANGPSLNQPVYIKNGETNLVKMTFGGWKWNTSVDTDDNNKVKSTYVVNGSTKKDEWNAATTSKESDIASIDGYKTSISGAQDAVDESKEASKKTIYGYTRYGWFKPAETRDDGYLETYPYTLPVRGAYMTFEPTQNGTLTVYILQNGAWNTFDQDKQIGDVLYKNGDIKPGEFRPHSFYICNQRGLNVDQFSPNTFTCTTKQKVQGDYYCDLTNNKTDPKNIATWTEFKDYMSADERSAVAANWKSGINGAQKIVQLDNGSYLAIQKGIVKYSFFVTANETYYLFSNFSKLGFCGANFVPSETVIPADDAAHKISLSDETAYPKTEKVIIDDKDPDKIKYAWKFGNEIKGYVPGFTIPLFNSITLKRTFKKGQWTTLTLPFNLTQTEVEQIFGKGTQILVFQDAQTKGTKLHIKFFYHEIQNILPGYPYLIKPTLEGYDGTPSTANAPIYTIDTSGDIPILTSFTVYDKAINPNIEQHEFTANPGESYVAKGTPDYCTQALTGVEGNFCKQYGKGDIFISEGNGKLYISKGSSYGKGYRSYIDYTGTDTSSAATKTLSLTFSGVEDGEDDGTTTEISVAELADDVIEAFGIKGVYNLNGQKVAETTRNLPAGIYVVNGRKVVVK